METEYLKGYEYIGVPRHLTVFSRNRRIRRLTAYIQKNLTEELTLEVLADYIGLTPSHLSRYFYDKTGIHLSKWIASQRAERARLLMLDSDIPISEVARRAGYTSESTFRRQFREHFDTSARQYRKVIELQSRVET